MTWALMACIYVGSGECDWQVYRGLEYDKRELCEAVAAAVLKEIKP